MPIKQFRRRDILRQLGALGITGTVNQLYSGSLFAGQETGSLGLADQVAGEVVNRTDEPVELLEIGDRAPGESVTYPDDDIALAPGPDGRPRFTRKDGTPFDDHG